KRMYNSPTSGDQLGGLFYSREEGKLIASKFNTTPYLGLKATKRNIMPKMSQYAILHFATHGMLDDHNGLYSALAFAPKKPSDTQYDVLEGQEIIEMRLSARMATLSACESGRGQKSGGEGALGLAWAFRAAGCPSVVASLWKVDDAATQELM